MYEFISGFLVLFHSFVYVYLYVSTHCFDYCSFVASLEIGKCEFSNVVFLFQYCLDYLRPLATS